MGKITEYYPNQRHEVGLIRIWKIVFQNVVESKDLIYQLFKRDFTAQYKKSFIGVAWAFIMPLFGIASWVLMQMTGVLQPGEVGVPYPVYVLIGSSCWGLFTDYQQAAGSTLTSAGGLLQQVKFSHEAILFKQILLKTVNFTISFVLILIGISLFGVLPKWQSIFAPLLMIPIFFYGTTIGLVMAMVNVVAVDVSRVVGRFMQFAIYTAPIVYSPDVENWFLQLINKWNPLTYLVCSMRDLFLYGRVYDWTGLLIASGIGLVAFMLVWRMFYVSEDKLVERML
ncbi:MAG: ABC transporter permease [Bacteroidota bacterium]